MLDIKLAVVNEWCKAVKPGFLQAACCDPETETVPRWIPRTPLFSAPPRPTLSPAQQSTPTLSPFSSLNVKIHTKMQIKWKKCSERRKHCTLAVARRSQKILPRRRPPPQGHGMAISWRWSLPSPTDPVWWRSMHSISSYLSNRPTNTHPQTGLITIHCAAKLSTQCNYCTETVHKVTFTNLTRRWKRKRL